MAEFIPFRFDVVFRNSDGERLCGGAFSEVSGFEASMSAQSFKEGGRNWGEVQLAGYTTFPALVLKRGVTSVRDFHQWFDITTRRANYGYRLDGEIHVYDRPWIDVGEPVKPVLRWKIERALATKFKGPDLSATASEVAIEELHLAHEGLWLMSDSEEAVNG